MDGKVRIFRVIATRNSISWWASCPRPPIFAKRAEIAKQLNDMLTEEGAHIPLIHRGNVSSHSLTLEVFE